MFWNAFVCGFAGSAGASIGLVMAVMLISLGKRKRTDEQVERINRSNDLLDQRNDIGRKMLKQIETLTTVIERRAR